MNDTSMTSITAAGFSLTQAAIDRVALLIHQDENGGDVFRVAVLGGGCSGFQYSFAIETGSNSDDHLLQLNDSEGTSVTVAIDEMSLEFLAGSQLDYVQELIGSYFQVSNPNATASCGCGTSFAI